MVLCFSELWVKPNSPPVDVPGLRLFMSPVHRRPGAKCSTSYLPGSCIYISNTLSVERNSFCTDVEDSCKLLNVTCCILSCKLTKVAIISVYRSPSICSNDCLTEIIDMFTQVSRLTIVSREAKKKQHTRPLSAELFTCSTALKLANALAKPP